MLKKLFHYDMKYTARLVLPLMLLTLGTTLLGSIAMKLLGSIEYSSFSTTFGATLLSIVLGLIVAGSIFILIAFAIITSIVVFMRFYKHFFSDEGYLTHTLPVKTSTHMFSKTWSTLLWVIITTVAVLLYIFLYILIGAAPYGSLLNMDTFRYIGEFFQAIFPYMTPSYWIIGLETLVLTLVSVVFSTFMIFTAITIGAVVAKKHKILAAIGFYYLINMIISIITVLVFVFISLSTVENPIFMGSLYSTPEGTTHFILIFSNLFYLGLSAGGFALCNRLLNKKLNLA